jgi:alpha-1,2-mannosyltransferase
VWTAASLLLLAYVVRRCLRTLGVPPGPALTAATVALVAVATWLDPVRTTLYLGQINLLLLALVVGDVLGRRDSRWRGVGVGLAAALKLTPLLFVWYLLLVGRIRAACVALGVFAATVALGFVLAPADSVAYWLQGRFAAADRISPPAATTNHSFNGLIARAFGETTWAYLLGALVLVAATAWVALRVHRRDQELLAVTLCGLCTAAVAPFAWSHHWVWTVPLLVLVGHQAVVRGGWRPVVLLAGLLVVTAAVITALPGPGVGPIPRTGLISLTPDAYLALFVVTLVVAGWSVRGVAAAR